MVLNKEDLPYFLAFVLQDEASRVPSGKRQTQPMRGFWMSRGGKVSMRKSDSRLRSSVCIEALRTIEQLSVEKAAAKVATELGRRTAAEVAVIRVAYYECRVSPHRLNSFVGQFLLWRDWVLGSDAETLQFLLKLYGKEFGKSARERLARLFDGIRSDAAQLARNRAWHLEAGQPQRDRIDSKHWDPESEWQQLATDLWLLARVHAGVGDIPEAKQLMERALGIWGTDGAVLPDIQAEAIAGLKEEIGRLAASAESKSNSASADLNAGEDRINGECSFKKQD